MKRKSIKSFLKTLFTCLLSAVMLILCFGCKRKTKFKHIKEDLAVLVETEKDIGLFLKDNNFSKDEVAEKEADAFVAFLVEELKTASVDYILDVLVDLVAEDFKITKELEDTILLALKKEKKVDEVAHFLRFLEKEDWLIRHKSDKIKTEITAHLQQQYSDLAKNDFRSAITYYANATAAFSRVSYYKVSLPKLTYADLKAYLEANEEVIYTEKDLGGYYDGCVDKPKPTFTGETFEPSYSYTTHHGDFKFSYRQTQYYNSNYEVDYKVDTDVYFKDTLISECKSLDGEWHKCGDYLYNIKFSGAKCILKLYSLKGYLGIDEVTLQYS